jgi:tetratricopeptide (TPR) repeat protein
LLLAPLLVAPVALNLVNLAILKPGSVDPSVEARALAVARALAWGPFHARVASAEADLAQERGDATAALEDLTDAAAGARWDATIAVRLAELHLAMGDRDGAVQAWRSNRSLLKVPLNRGLAVRAASPTVALDWFGTAQAVDPTDPRPYLETAELLLSSQEAGRAAPFTAQALRLSGTDPVFSVLANRVLDPFSPLDTPTSSPPRVVVVPAYQAAQVMDDLGDVLGAIYADEVALSAEPSNASVRAHLAKLHQRLSPGN